MRDIGAALSYEYRWKRTSIIRFSMSKVLTLCARLRHCYLRAKLLWKHTVSVLMCVNPVVFCIMVRSLVY